MALTQVTAGLLDNSTQTYGMKNRIINGGMAIDQRNAGATQAITSAGTPTYCLDRWAISLGNTASGTLTTQRVTGDAINQYAVRIARTAGTYADNIRFYQVIETSNCYDLQGNNITISWRARQGSSYTGGAQVLTVFSGSGTDQGIASMVAATWTTSALTSPTITGTLSTSFSTFTATFAVPASTAEIGIRIATGNFSGTGSANDYLDITGVQLEKGSTATSFDYRPYGTELALCQRYAIVCDSNNGFDMRVQGSSAWVVSLYYPVWMRATPSLIVSSLGTYKNTAGAPGANQFQFVNISSGGSVTWGTAPTTLSMTTQDAKHTYIYQNSGATASEAVTGQMYNLTLGTGSSFTLSAEL